LLAVLAAWPGLAASGTLIVNLGPPEVVSAGARFRLLGESDWMNSGVARTNLAPGAYFLEFKGVEGWEVPVGVGVQDIQESTFRVVSATYAVIPLHPVVVTSTTGGYVQEQAWEPQLFFGLEPSGPGSSSAPNLAWESARRMTPRPMRMPRENLGYRVRLRALAFPGYEFVGWTGDVTGSRNPVNFVVQGPRAIQAHFARVLTSVHASIRSAEPCPSPGVTRLHAQFSLSPGSQLDRVEWRPELPAGWELVEVSGLGGPRVDGGVVVFDGPLGHNPIQFNLHVNVPAGEAGGRVIGGVVHYRLVSEVSDSVREVGALPVLVEPTAAARLRVALDGDGSRIEVEGVVGKTYTLEQSAALLGPPMWSWVRT